MSDTFRQQNGKNWREVVLAEDRLVITSSIEGISNKATLPYDMGMVSPDLDEMVMGERPGSGKLAGVAVGASVLTLFASFPLMGSKNSGLVGLGFLVMIGAMVGFFLALNSTQPKKTKMLRVFIGNGFFYCYGRTQQDRDQVEALVAKIAEAQTKYFRDKYLARNDAMTADQIKSRLSWLYEHKLIDDKELAAELKKLPKT